MTSPALNTFIILGCIFIYSSVFLYGIDHSNIADETLTILCYVSSKHNLQFSYLMLSFIFLFLAFYFVCFAVAVTYVIYSVSGIYKIQKYYFLSIQLQYSTTAVGFTFAMGSLFMKTYRVQTVYDRSIKCILMVSILNLIDLE